MEGINEIISQLAHFDHEHDSDILSYLTEAVTEIKQDHLSTSEATELINDKVSILKAESILTEDEHIRLVEAFIAHLPALLAL